MQKQRLSLAVLAVLGLALAPVAARAQEPAADAGGKAKIEALTSALAKAIDASPAAAAKVKAFAKAKLIPQCTNAILVQAAQEQNAKKVTLDEIKKLDAQWQAAEDELPLMKEKLANACAKEIARLAAANPGITEAFATDNQGANVGQNGITSDYWQGDEPKWQNAFNGGQGGVDVGKLGFDKSANAMRQQVSLPLIAAAGTVVGAVTYGLAVEKL